MKTYKTKFAIGQRVRAKDKFDSYTTRFAGDVIEIKITEKNIMYGVDIFVPRHFKFNSDGLIKRMSGNNIKIYFPEDWLE